MPDLRSLVIALRAIILARPNPYQAMSDAELRVMQDSYRLVPEMFPPPEQDKP